MKASHFKQHLKFFKKNISIEVDNVGFDVFKVVVSFPSEGVSLTETCCAYRVKSVRKSLTHRLLSDFKRG